jgi:hypothetical protein
MVVHASCPGDAGTIGKSQIGRSEPAYASLDEVTCLAPPGKGVFGVGKKPGDYQLVFGWDNLRVTMEYRTPAKITVTYGPRKLLCEKCGKTMTETGGSSAPARDGAPGEAIIQLQCLPCHIARTEPQYEIDGHWYEWADGRRTVV